MTTPPQPEQPDFNQQEQDEYFPENPTPYTIDALRWFTDAHGERHYY